MKSTSSDADVVQYVLHHAKAAEAGPIFRRFHGMP